MIWHSTKIGERHQDLILHEEVPELVYLQTRKLLREVHLAYAEYNREQYALIGTIADDAGQNQPNQKVPENNDRHNKARIRILKKGTSTYTTIFQNQRANTQE